MNQYIDKCDAMYNVSTPEIPTMVNIIKNAIVFRSGDILTSNFLYKYSKEFVPPQAIDVRPLEVFDQAIPWFHQFSKCYFHFLIETFPLIVSFGKEITQNSVLLHSSLLKKQFNEICSILDLQFKRVVFVGTPVFVKKLYITNPYIYDQCNPNALRHFIHLLLTKTNLTNLKATQNVIYNRKKNRKIKNFNELCEALHNEMPNITFTLYKDSPSLRSQIEFFRKTRFLMLVHGSTLSNMIFMQKNTAVFELAKKDCRATFVLLSKVVGVRLHEIYFLNQTKVYFNQWVDIPVLVQAVKKILTKLDLEEQI